MSHRCQIAFLLLLATLPVCILIKEFSFEHGFLDVPRFGKEYLKRALPEVKKINPPARSRRGYDGQLYAQIALSPLLTDSDLPHACDNFRYRARRIGLPMLAYAIGLGRPAWILQSYSVLNFFFWLALMGAMARFVGFVGLRERLLVLAILWTSGTLFSLKMALADLPATTISVWGMVLAETHVVAAGWLLALTALFKETSVVSFPAIAWVDRNNSPRRLVWMIPLLISPVLLWLLYVQLKTPYMATKATLFRFPFAGWWEKLSGALPRSPNNLSEFWVPLSLGVQVAYMAAHTRLTSAWWRWGIGWAVMATLMGGPLVLGQGGYTRVLLPLTVAFNVLVYQHEKRWAYILWFLLGNISMFSCAWMDSPWWLTRACVAWFLFECWHQWSSTRSLTWKSAVSIETPSPQYPVVA